MKRVIYPVCTVALLMVSHRSVNGSRTGQSPVRRVVRHTPESKYLGLYGGTVSGIVCKWTSTSFPIVRDSPNK